MAPQSVPFPPRGRDCSAQKMIAIDIRSHWTSLHAGVKKRPNGHLHRLLGEPSHLQLNFLGSFSTRTWVVSTFLGILKVALD